MSWFWNKKYYCSLCLVELSSSEYKQGQRRCDKCDQLYENAYDVELAVFLTQYRKNGFDVAWYVENRDKYLVIKDKKKKEADTKALKKKMLKKLEKFDKHAKNC